MLATKLDAATNFQTQVQPRDYERRRDSRRTAVRTKSRFDYISLFGCIVICAVAGWILASMSARVAGMNAQIVQLKTQIQQASAVNASYSASLDRLTQPAHILAVAAAHGMKQGQPIMISAQGSSGAN